MTTYYYYVNLDERGVFFSDVRDEDGNTIGEIHGVDLVEGGFINDLYDPYQIEMYYKYLGLIMRSDEIVKRE